MDFVFKYCYLNKHHWNTLHDLFQLKHGSRMKNTEQKKASALKSNFNFRIFFQYKAKIKFYIDDKEQKSSKKVSFQNIFVFKSGKPNQHYDYNNNAASNVFYYINV